LHKPTPIRNESAEQKKARARQIEKLLRKEYPSTQTALHYSTPFHLVVAVILSAQCTDVRVNMVTPLLFARFNSVHDFASADTKELERLIHSAGFYHNKAKNIIGCAQELLRRYKGIVPETMDELVTLPGVGRKTANVVLGEAFGKVEGVVVDTHVTRLSNRLGFTTHDDAVKIEKDLMLILPKKIWYTFSHRLIFHGRKICSARKPLCAQCSLHALCPSSTI
jgi:endonuclease III